MPKIRQSVMRIIPLMITCAELDAFIVDYLDGTLPKRQRAIFNFHLRMCRVCRIYLESYRKTIEIGRAVFDHAEDAISDDIPEALVHAILAARRKEP